VVEVRDKAPLATRSLHEREKGKKANEARTSGRAQTSARPDPE